MWAYNQVYYPGMSPPNTSGYCPSDPLSDTLSARSYLEPDQIASLDANLSRDHEAPSPFSEGEYMDVDVLGFPDLNATVLDEEEERTKCQLQKPLDTSPSDNSRSNKHVSKRGRPRLETGVISAIQERRSQIRRVQRTYRLKKEAGILDLRARVAELEKTLQTVSDLLTDLHEVTRRSDLNNLQLLVSDTTSRALAEIERSNSSSNPNSNSTVTFQGLGNGKDDKSKAGQPDMGHSDSVEHLHQPATAQKDSADIFGYHLFNQSATDGSRFEGSLVNAQCQLLRWRRERALSLREKLMSRSIERLLPGSTIHSYSSLGPQFSRRLLRRSSLQHTYRWVIDSTVDPSCLFRVFGLTLPSLAGKSLKRVMGQLADSIHAIKGKEKYKGSETKLLDFDGEWLNCHDVQGYLKQKGILLDKSSVLVEIPMSTIRSLRSQSAEQGSPSLGWVDLNSEDISARGRILEDDENTLDHLPDEKSQLTETLGIDVPAGQLEENPVGESSDYFLDVEGFFNLLLQRVRLLGRVPGLRKSDVDIALKSAVRRRP